MKKYINELIVAILISGPIAGILLAFLDPAFIHVYFMGENYAFYQFDTVFFHAFTYAAFFYAFYIVFGLPTTLVSDAIAKLYRRKNKAAPYIVYILTYTGAGFLLWYWFNIPELGFKWYIFIPVYTYLLTVHFVRAKELVTYE